MQSNGNKLGTMSIPKLLFQVSFPIQNIMIGIAVGMAIGCKIGAVFSVVGGSIVGTLAGGYFPEYYISIKKQVEYEYPIKTQRPKMRTINYIYHGPKYDRYQNYWFSF